MYVFVNTQTMEYPVFEGHIKFENGISDTLVYPEYELPSKYAVVTQSQVPSYDTATQTVDEVRPPVLVDGQWTTSYLVRAMTEEELAAKAVSDARVAALQAEMAAIMAAHNNQPPSVIEVIQIP